MHTALSTDEWLAQNAQYCNRYHARFTVIHCEENRQKPDDLRCAGCTGLEDQHHELKRKDPVVFYSDPEAEEPVPITQALAGALQEVLDCEDLENPDEADDDLDGFHSELLALMEDDFEEPVERKPEKKGPKRFAVFMGRCPRCKGYMLNAPERYSDIRDGDVYRCFTCGYRTSPGYEWNRR